MLVEQCRISNAECTTNNAECAFQRKTDLVSIPNPFRSQIAPECARIAFKPLGSYPTISLLNAILAHSGAIPAHFSQQNGLLIAEPMSYDTGALPVPGVPRARYSGFEPATYDLHCDLHVERCKS